MSTIRGGVEQSRERLVALVLLLQRAWQYGALTQEEILRELKIDEYPVAAKGPRKIPAYEGTDSTVRQKFERDKARIRELGFEIETVVNERRSRGLQDRPLERIRTAHLLHAPTRSASFVWPCGSAVSVSPGAFSVFNDVPRATGDSRSPTTTRPCCGVESASRAVV